MFRQAAALTLALASSSVEAYSLQKRDGAAAHDHAAPAPATGYEQPSSGYEQPSSGYEQPEATSGYAYASPSTGYGNEPALPDLTPIIVALLVLTGLSLLFPTYVSVARRKREADEDVSPMTDIVERVNDIYMSVVESEECMERIACEVGGLASDVGLKANAYAKMADPFVPAKYKTFYKQFTSGSNCHKIKCGAF